MDKYEALGGVQQFNPPSYEGYMPQLPETFRVGYYGSKVCIAKRNKSLGNLVRFRARFTNCYSKQIHNNLLQV